MQGVGLVSFSFSCFFFSFFPLHFPHSVCHCFAQPFHTTRQQELQKKCPQQVKKTIDNFNALITRVRAFHCEYLKAHINKAEKKPNRDRERNEMHQVLYKKSNRREKQEQC